MQLGLYDCWVCHETNAKLSVEELLTRKIPRTLPKLYGKIPKNSQNY